jgi:hypothetical protein
MTTAGCLNERTPVRIDRKEIVLFRDARGNLSLPDFSVNRPRAIDPWVKGISAANEHESSQMAEGRSPLQMDHQVEKSDSCSFVFIRG